MRIAFQRETLAVGGGKMFTFTSCPHCAWEDCSLDPAFIQQLEAAHSRAHFNPAQRRRVTAAPAAQEARA